MIHFVKGVGKMIKYAYGVFVFLGNRTEAIFFVNQVNPNISRFEPHARAQILAELR